MTEETSSAAAEELNEVQDVSENEEYQEPDQADEPSAADEEDAYAKAWESIDTTKDPSELFEETASPDEHEPAEEVGSEPVEENVPQTEGLVIPNPVLKRRGKEIRIDNADELLALAEKGFDYSFKMGKLKPHMAMIRTIEESGITREDIKALADLKSGNKGALGYLKRISGIEGEAQSDDFFATGSDDENVDEYTPEVPQSDPVMEWYNDFTEKNPTAGAKVAEQYAEIDDSFKAEVYDPQIFPRFAASIASGEFEKVYPEAMKIKALNDSIPWLQAYIVAGQRLAGANPVKEEKKEEPPKSAKIPRQNGSGNRRRTGNDYDKAWQMDISELETKLFG